MPFSFNRSTVAPKSKGKLNYKAVFERYGNQFNFPRHLAGAVHKFRTNFTLKNTPLPDNKLCKRTNKPNYPFPTR